MQTHDRIHIINYWCECIVVCYSCSRDGCRSFKDQQCKILLNFPFKSTKYTQIAEWRHLSRGRRADSRFFQLEEESRVFLLWWPDQSKKVQHFCFFLCFPLFLFRLNILAKISNFLFLLCSKHLSRRVQITHSGIRCALLLFLFYYWFLFSLWKSEAVEGDGMCHCEPHGRFHALWTDSHWGNVLHKKAPLI